MSGSDKAKRMTRSTFFANCGSLIGSQVCFFVLGGVFSLNKIEWKRSEYIKYKKDNNTL